MLTIIIVGIAAFIVGAFFAWNNTKASIKAKIDAEITKATAPVAAALTTIKAKL